MKLIPIITCLLFFGCSEPVHNEMYDLKVYSSGVLILRDTLYFQDHWMQKGTLVVQKQNGVTYMVSSPFILTKIK